MGRIERLLFVSKWMKGRQGDLLDCNFKTKRYRASGLNPNGAVILLEHGLSERNHQNSRYAYEGGCLPFRTTLAAVSSHSHSRAT